MFRFYLLLFYMLILQSCFSVRSSNHFSYQKLTPELYAEKLKQNHDVYLFDVRTPGEFRKSRIHGAINYSFLAFNFGKRVDSLDRSKTVFIYCHTCHRSPFCARILRRKGFTQVYDMEKGFTKWLKNSFPVDTGTISIKNQH